MQRPRKARKVRASHLTRLLTDFAYFDLAFVVHGVSTSQLTPWFGAIEPERNGVQAVPAARFLRGEQHHLVMVIARHCTKLGFYQCQYLFVLH